METVRQILDEHGISQLSSGKFILEAFARQQREIESLKGTVTSYVDALGNTLNQTRRKRDEVKGKLESTLKENKELRQEIKRLDSGVLTDKEWDIIKQWGFTASVMRPLSDEEKELYFKLSE